MTADYYFLI